MNKIILILSIIAALFIGGLCGYSLKRDSISKESEARFTDIETKLIKVEGGLASVVDFINRTISQAQQTQQTR